MSRPARLVRLRKVDGLMFVFWFYLFVRVESLTEVNRLFEDLFGHYNKLVRPISVPTESIKIRFKFKLLNILDVREKEQVVVTNGWLIQVCGGRSTGICAGFGRKQFWAFGPF